MEEEGQSREYKIIFSHVRKRVSPSALSSKISYPDLRLSIGVSKAYCVSKPLQLLPHNHEALFTAEARMDT